jgi:Membrane bound O-acyl transferase family
VARVYQTRAELLRANLKTFILGYLILDLLKVTINHDPYFWGLPDRPPPAYLPTLLTRPHTPPLLPPHHKPVPDQKSLQTAFSPAPPSSAASSAPTIGARAAPWVYPDAWGSYVYVLDRGLAGWAGWWHQTFRFAFAEPARKLVALARLDPRSRPAKLLRLATAFALSGFLHACASYTQPGPTRLLRGPFCFFVLQAAGGGGTAGEVGVCACVVLSYGAVGGRFCEGRAVVVRAGPYQSAACVGARRQGDGWWCWGG